MHRSLIWLRARSASISSWHGSWLCCCPTLVDRGCWTLWRFHYTWCNVVGKASIRACFSVCIGGCTCNRPYITFLYHALFSVFYYKFMLISNEWTRCDNISKFSFAFIANLSDIWIRFSDVLSSKSKAVLSIITLCHGSEATSLNL